MIHRDTADELHDIADDLASPEMMLTWPMIVGNAVFRIRTLARHIRALEKFADEQANIALAAEQATTRDNIIKLPFYS